jgi:hypothetical protein
MQLRDSSRQLLHDEPMRLKQPLKFLFLTAAFVLLSGGLAYGRGTATGLSGLYYTGDNANGGLLAGGSNDPNWSVGFASINGGTSANTTYEGAAYVINSSYLSGQGYVPNTSAAQWITAPGASSAQTGGTLNTGGNYLPGNGNTGSNEGIYVYTLALQITGTVTNNRATINNQNISISLTIAADDQYQVYLNAAGVSTAGVATNPSGINPTSYTGTMAGSGLSAWGNTTAVMLANYTATGYTNNSVFVVGTNYLTIVVDNTNSITGASGSTALNPSGVLLYQTANVITINGTPVQGTVPETGTWLPITAALGLFGWCAWRRRPGVASVV